MKNRTFLGAVCIVLAIAVTFLVAPLTTKLSEDKVDVPRLNRYVEQGTVISENDIETVSINADAVPSGIIRDNSEIIGKYAVSSLYAGDYITKAKISDAANTADDVFSTLDGTKVAVSVNISSYAAGLSGKLENGDIISLVVLNKSNGEADIPEEFHYVKVITTTTSGGIDQENVVKNEDGSYEAPSTITLLVNTEQAKLLAEYEDSATISVALVYRGTVENAEKFLEAQDEYFEQLAATNETGKEENPSSSDNAEESSAETSEPEASSEEGADE